MARQFHLSDNQKNPYMTIKTTEVDLKQSQIKLKHL